jgi:hypothetical protein
MAAAKKESLELTDPMWSSAKSATGWAASGDECWL